MSLNFEHLSEFYLSIFFSDKNSSSPMVNITNILWAHLHQYSCANNSSNLKCKYQKARRKTLVLKKVLVKCWWNWHLIHSWVNGRWTKRQDVLGNEYIFFLRNLSYFHWNSLRQSYNYSADNYYRKLVEFSVTITDVQWCHMLLELGFVTLFQGTCLISPWPLFKIEYCIVPKSVTDITA